MVFYKKSGYLCSPLMFKQSNFIQSSYLGLIVGWTAFACSSSVKPKYLVEYYLEIKCLWAYKVFVSWKELISHQIASVEISTVSKSVWLLRMAETYWQAEGLKAARSWLFLMRRKAWNNISQSAQPLAPFLMVPYFLLTFKPLHSWNWGLPKKYWKTRITVATTQNKCAKLKLLFAITRKTRKRQNKLSAFFAMVKTFPQSNALWAFLHIAISLWKPTHPHTRLYQEAKWYCSTWH